MVCVGRPRRVARQYYVVLRSYVVAYTQNRQLLAVRLVSFTGQENEKGEPYYVVFHNNKKFNYCGISSFASLK